ncbi:hypothetical protein [Mycobacteroides chelonae]|uniref:hypothetical protein n=1 Tax=Mycobacteroides chelonae TaxID=1774 RepID=UPI0010425BD9|nr:hypothetical protein [Mycobacteroides chelonae]
MSVNTIKHYRRKKMLPAPPDIEIIDATGKVVSEAWFPHTIDTWDAECRTPTLPPMVVDSGQSGPETERRELRSNRR